MKSLLILPLLTVGALANDAHFDNNQIRALVERAIDPKTMDPVRFSVLSVLRTAMPTGVDGPFPTGDSEPEWYQKLPADVKSLLPSLYPAPAPAPAATAPVTSDAVSSTPAPTSSAAASVASSSVLLPSTTVLASLDAVSSSALGSSTPISASTASPLSFPPPSNLTKTAQSAPSATSPATAPTTGLGNSTGATSTRGTNGTLPSASPSSTSVFFSAGTRTVIRVETFATLVWAGIGAGFLFFV